MLRKKLGDHQFWSGVQTYLDDYKNSFAETDDFRRCLEKASGFHLSRFFEDWFRRPGCPKVKVEGSQSDNGYAVTLEQVLATPQDEPFELTVTVGVKSKDGSWLYRTGELESGRAVLSFDNLSTPEAVVVDPYGDSLFELESALPFDIYANMVTNCCHLLGRVQAAAYLLQNGSRVALEAVNAAYKDEPHFGVRRLFIKYAMAKPHGRTTRLLLEWLTLEKDARVKPLLGLALKGER